MQQMCKDKSDCCVFYLHTHTVKFASGNYRQQTDRQSHKTERKRNNESSFEVTIYRQRFNCEMEMKIKMRLKDSINEGADVSQFT